MATAGMEDFLSRAFRYQAALKPVSIRHLRKGVSERAPGSPCKQGFSGHTALQPFIYKGSRAPYPISLYIRASEHHAW